MMKTKETQKELMIEKVDLGQVELMEETLTPSFGIYCPHGWFGFGCH